MKKIKIKNHFKLNKVEVDNDEYILIKMRGDCNDTDYVYAKDKLPLDEHTLSVIYLLEISKNERGRIEDTYLFDFICNNFIGELPNGYESPIHTLEYELKYYINNEEYDIDLIKNSIPDNIREWIDNIIKVHSINDIYYYNNDLLKIIIKLYDTNFLSKLEIEKLLDKYSRYDYCDEFSDMVEDIRDGLSKDELVEEVYNYLINLYSK